jgi:hypothetical protein
LQATIYKDIGLHYKVLMRKLYFFIIIFSSLAMMLPSEALAKERSYMVSDSIRWQPPKNLFPGHSLFFFDGAVNHDSLGFLPVYYYSIPKAYTGKISAISLLNGVYEPLETEDLSMFPDLDLISAEPVIILSTSQNRKIPAQSLYLLPLRKAQGKEGFEKLVSFKLKIDLEDDHVQAAARSNTLRSYAGNSVLRTGDWYRFAVRETGIYKLSYQDLAGLGINPDQIDPRNIRLYGNGSGMLEEANSLPRTDDLMENAIFIEGETDGTFDPEDYILFYGESPVSITYNAFFQKYEHEVNFYTDKTFYFLTLGDGPGKRVQQGNPVVEEPTHEVYNFEDFAYYEKDELNLIKSGKMWYGEVFNTQLEHFFQFDLKGIDLAEPLYLKVTLAGRSTTNTIFNVFAEGSQVAELGLPSVVLGSSIYARAITSNYELFYAEDENVEVGISFVKPGSIDVGWLNYIELNYIHHLNFTGSQLSFRDMRPVGAGNIARYHLQTSIQEVTVWEVSNPGSIIIPTASAESGGISIKIPSDTLKEFIAFDGTQFFTPEFIEKVENQNLHNLQPVDFVIVTYPLFLEQAHRLADYHRQWDGMTVHVVTPQQIYNEFSSGAQDVSAIRDFMKMLYDRGENGQEPRYLLLFGDASYDYKNLTAEDNNMVPAYESRESLKSAASFVTDDFFGCLDDDEGSNGSGTMDIGVGRFPVQTVEEAEAMVDKTFHYMMPDRENYGPWRNSVVYIGDDEDNNIHLGQAEGLVSITDSLGTVYNVNKIYLDAYLQQQTPSGIRYPDVNAAIDKAVNDGCLIINYTGHGGETGWAAEKVLDIPAIQAYKNITHMPAFVTATCEFSRYDDPGLVSAGELVFLNPEGAGIGLFTTTRLAYSQSNYALNKRFYYEAFVIDSLSGEYPRMGDLIRVAKTPSNQNIKNFVLLGDPALMLAYPKMQVRTDSITNDVSGEPVDTLHALSRVTISGHVEDLQGNKLEGFNGVLYPSVFDKPVRYKTRGNDPTSKIVDFYIQDKVIYKGEISITKGEFSFTFVVPLDISYQYGEGKISYYALDTVNLTDAHGYDPVWIGGSDSLAIMDDVGPSIDLYLNTLSFISGDLTTPDPMLIARLYDESGINTVGNGIGHDLVAIVDDNYQEPLILNDQFTPETDSYQKGQILYRLGTLSNGTHTLTLKAWDVLNNSSEKTIEFQVNVGARLAISNVHNRPNPFRESTEFVFEHNKPGSALEVTIRVYSLMGQHMTTLHYSIEPESTESGLLYWNGRDASGNELPSGLYVYHLQVESDDGYLSSTSQKLLHFK